jgi:hypothetical protein
MNLFFDIECFKYDSFVVIKDEKRRMKVFHDKNGFEGLGQFIKGHTLIGYNNYFYDDHMIDAMLKGWSQQQIKDLNDRIIACEKQRPKNNFRSLDCFQQIDNSFPSLKKIQGNLSLNIYESAIPFDIDRPLTKEEWIESVNYCSNDVDSTILVYELRENSYFKPKASLVERVGKGEKWNTTTLSANAILGNKTLPKWSDIRLNGKDFSDLSLLELVPEAVQEMFRKADINAKGKDAKVVIDMFNCKIEFGGGGLHGVHKKKKKVKNMKLLDVKSMYPHIILILNVLGEFTKVYREILDERIAIKHIDEILSESLKLILNSVYGNLGQQYSSLFNPKAQLSVCYYGQIALFTLCKMLYEDGHEIININTDGVGFVPAHDGYKKVWKDWENIFKNENAGLELELDEFSVFVQKDVNNYIGVAPNGKIKVKGGDVGRYKGDVPFKNNSSRIYDIAIVDFLLYGKSVVDTLVENLENPKLFQFILQAGHTYQGTYDAEGTKYNKVNRIFPTKDKNAICLYKKRHDDGLVRFPDLPERMYVFNDDVSKIEDFEKIVDLNHYLSVINKKLERWTA